MKIRKYNIEKKQSGGIIYTPFVPSYTDSEAESSSSSSSSSDVGKIGDVQKEIMDVLQENGLPSDVDYFMQTAKRFLRKAEITGNWSMSDFTRIQSLANRVAHNKTLYDSATQHLTETGNWNEIALDNKGQMYVVDKDGNLDTISPLEYYKNKNNYQALTNNDILEYRSQATPFNSSVLNDAAGSIGVNDVTEYVKGIILDSGTRSISGYTNSEMAQKDESLNRLLADGPRGYYKYKEEAQNGGGPTTQAVEYLYNALPNNMKQLLIAKTAAEGKNPEQYAPELLVQMLTNHLDYDLSVDYDSAATNASGKSGSDSSGSVSDTYLRKVSDFSNIRPDQVNIVPNYDSPSSQGMMTVTAYRLGTITDRLTDNIDTDKFSLNYLISKAEFIKSGNTDMISIGGRVLNPAEFNKVMINNSNQVIGAVLPYKVDDRGRYVPDFSKVEAFNVWNKLIQNNPDITEMEAQDLAEQCGLNEKDVEYDHQTKSFKLRNTMQFYGVSAYINSEVIDVDNDMKKYLYHMTRQEGKELKNEYDNLLLYRTTTPTKQDKKIGDLGFLGKTKDGNANAFYEGMLFIPITNPEIGSLLTVHGKLSNDMANNPTAVMTVDQILQQSREYTNEDIGGFH